MSTIVDKLTAVKTTVGELGKDSENKEGRKFKFRSVDAVVNAIAQALIDNGVLIHSTSAELIASEQVQYGIKKTLAFRTTIAVEYEWTDGESSITSQVLAESIDPGDKGTSKAMSVAYRTAILQTLSLPTGARDPDYEDDGKGEGGEAGDVSALLGVLGDSGFNLKEQGDIISAALGRKVGSGNFKQFSAEECSIAAKAITAAVADRLQLGTTEEETF